MNKPSISIPERIKIFEIVRDIPYHIGLDGEQDYCCATKTPLLMLALSPLKTRYKVCDFRWDDLPLPKKILKLHHEPIDTHAYLEVYVPERGVWVALDPTLDSGLGKHLKIAKWDGLSSTSLAVNALRVWPDSEVRKDLSTDGLFPKNERYFGDDREFLMAVNNYFESIRGAK